MADSLVDSLSPTFEPEKYRDKYREQVLDLIDRRHQVRVRWRPRMTAEAPKVVDLMAALEASVAAAKDARSRIRRPGRDEERGCADQRSARHVSTAKANKSAPSRRPALKKKSASISAAWSCASLSRDRGRWTDALSLSNLDKVLYPTRVHQGRDHRLLRADRADDVAAPGRTRHHVPAFPDGADKKGFFEKRCPKHRPEWVEPPSARATTRVKSGTAASTNRRPWCGPANMAALEIHAPMALAEDLDTPNAACSTSTGRAGDIVECCQVALRAREVLRRSVWRRRPRRRVRRVCRCTCH